jgi:hypothetical protein
METCATENGGEYSACGTEVALQGVEESLFENGNEFVEEATKMGAKTYKFGIKNENTEDTFFIERGATGKLVYECTGTGGGCPSSGKWTS